MKREEFRFFHKLRVRWAEVDMQKIVFNAHYLMYMDTAVAGYWRALAAPYAHTMESLGGDLYVRKASVEYHASAVYDDVLDVGIRCARIGNSSMVFAAGIFRGERLLVGGELVYVFADPATQTSRPVPPLLREVLQAFEAGQPMVQVRCGDWAGLGAQAQPVRSAVFVEEQGIPAEREWDAADAGAIHAVAFNRFGQAVGTGRLIESAPGVGQIGRMAVLAPMRGQSIGRELLDALVEAARAAGWRELRLHAQTTAAAFYRRSGFVEQGAVYEEVGLPHVDMVRRL